MNTPEKKPRALLLPQDPTFGRKYWIALAGFFLITLLLIVPVMLMSPSRETPEPIITRAGLAEVTWFRPKDKSFTVAAHHRHGIPDGAYIEFVNPNVAPAAFVIVRKQGHLAKDAVADFDLCPEAFSQLAPLSHGRLRNIEWRIVRQ